MIEEIKQRLINSNLTPEDLRTALDIIDEVVEHERQRNNGGLEQHRPL